MIEFDAFKGIDKSVVGPAAVDAAATVGGDAYHVETHFHCSELDLAVGSPSELARCLDNQSPTASPTSANQVQGQSSRPRLLRHRELGRLLSNFSRSRLRFLSTTLPADAKPCTAAWALLEFQTISQIHHHEYSLCRAATELRSLLLQGLITQLERFDDSFSSHHGLLQSALATLTEFRELEFPDAVVLGSSCHEENWDHDGVCRWCGLKGSLPSASLRPPVDNFGRVLCAFIDLLISPSTHAETRAVMEDTLEKSTMSESHTKWVSKKRASRKNRLWTVADFNSASYGHYPSRLKKIHPTTASLTWSFVVATDYNIVQILSFILLQKQTHTWPLVAKLYQ
ncbi:unnamed protein product [Trichogramma brassicae]|uniref:Uncharacterized protein n=1 Tax=Trichogramma brassicae TaxID=86971 RepID=A0A6H5HUR1_9HYME|nr:unnamed protein product [Trichogramma brassicae]